MNPIILTQYIPAINAYINHAIDSSPKIWRDVVLFFFDLNKDEELQGLTDLAMSFKYASHPNYFSVSVNAINKYFDEKKITKKELISARCVEEVDFIDSPQGLRLTFQTFRRFVFLQEDDDLIEAYNFIENIYNMHSRYMTRMIARGKTFTHWALLEKTAEATKTQMINGEEGNQKIFIVVRGSYKSLVSKLRKIRNNLQKYEDGILEYESDLAKFNEERSQQKPKRSIRTSSSVAEITPPKLEEKILKLKPKFKTNFFTPIMEVVAESFELEIYDVITYIDQMRLKPFKEEQVSSKEVKNIKNAFNNIKASKNCFLLSTDQDDYIEQDLLRDIHDVRRMIQRGDTIHSKPFTIKKYLKKTKKTSQGTVDIDMFAQTNGEFMDEDKQCPLSKPVRDNISILMSEFDDIEINDETKDDIIDDISEGEDMDLDL